MLEYIARGIILKQFKNKVCQITSKHFRWEGERLVEMTCVPLHDGMPGSCSPWATHRQWLQCSEPQCGLSRALNFSFSLQCDHKACGLGAADGGDTLEQCTSCRQREVHRAMH